MSVTRLDAAGRTELNASMLKLADGDRAAFQPIFRTLFPRVRAWCERLLGNAHDGEDAAQQALIKLFAQADQFDPTGDALTWALTLATWECKTYRRKGGRHAMATLPLATPVATPEDIAIHINLEHALETLLHELSEADQTLLAAAAQGKPSLSSALRKRRERAIARLKLLWRERHGNPKY